MAEGGHNSGTTRSIVGDSDASASPVIETAPASHTFSAASFTSAHEPSIAPDAFIAGEEGGELGMRSGDDGGVAEEKETEMELETFLESIGLETRDRLTFPTAVVTVAAVVSVTRSPPPQVPMTASTKTSVMSSSTNQLTKNAWSRAAARIVME